MEHKQAMYAQELELQNVKAEKDKEAKRLVITANVQHVTYISYFLQEVLDERTKVEDLSKELAKLKLDRNEDQNTIQTLQKDKEQQEEENRELSNLSSIFDGDYWNFQIEFYTMYYNAYSYRLESEV